MLFICLGKGERVSSAYFGAMFLYYSPTWPIYAAGHQVLDTAYMLCFLGPLLCHRYLRDLVLQSRSLHCHSKATLL